MDVPSIHDLRRDPARGEQLDREEFERDYLGSDAEARGWDTWKFERRQSFQELHSPSWEAFRRGERDEAMRLLEERRAQVLGYVAEDAERGNAFRRVRVVEEPLTPYLQWELHSLRLESECGWATRIVGPEAVGRWEEAGPLPELVVHGKGTVYEVRYDEAGLLSGAVRFDDPGLADRWQRFIAELHAGGEEVGHYVARHPGLTWRG